MILAGLKRKVTKWDGLSGKEEKRSCLVNLNKSSCLYNEGERSGKKKDPASVVELMKLATKDAIKPFTPPEYLRKEQISAYFSHLTIQRRKGKGVECIRSRPRWIQGGQ